MTWVTMALVLMQAELWSGPHKRERHHWSTNKALLLNVRVSTTSKMLNSVLRSWWEVSRNLCFDHHLDIIPRRLSIQQLLHLVDREEGLTKQQQQDILVYCRVWDNSAVADFWEEEGL